MKREERREREREREREKGEGDQGENRITEHEYACFFEGDSLKQRAHSVSRIIL